MKLSDMEIVERRYLKVWNFALTVLLLHSLSWAIFAMILDIFCDSSMFVLMRSMNIDRSVLPCLIRMISLSKENACSAADFENLSATISVLAFLKAENWGVSSTKGGSSCVWYSILVSYGIFK